MNNIPDISIYPDLKLVAPKVTPLEVEGIFSCYSDPNVSVYIPDSCIPKTLFDAQNILNTQRRDNNNGNSFFWLIYHAISNSYIGTISIFNIDKLHKRAEVSYDLHSKFWRQGVMTNCLNCVLDYIFLYVGLNRVEANTITTNTSSRQLLKKCGFAQEGTLAQYKFYKGKFTDVLMFGQTAEMHSNYIDSSHLQGARLSPYVFTCSESQNNMPDLANVINGRINPSINDKNYSRVL